MRSNVDFFREQMTHSFQPATHECAHAVVAMALGANVSRVSLCPDGSGLTEFDTPFQPMEENAVARCAFSAGFSFDSLWMRQELAAHQSKGDAVLFRQEKLNECEVIATSGKADFMPEVEMIQEAAALFNDSQIGSSLELARFLIANNWLHFTAMAMILGERRVLGPDILESFDIKKPLFLLVPRAELT